MTWNYSKKTTELFMNAVQGKPGSHLGEIEDPDGIGEHGSIACGDALRFCFRTEKHASDPRLDRITEARYLTFGCTSAIAASEALCAIIEEGNFTPITALGITNNDIVSYLDGLPQQKIHCSVMGAEALEGSIFDWAQRRGVDLNELGIDILREEQEEGRLVCTCFGLTEPYLLRKISELGLRTIADVSNAVKAGGACMSCHHVPGGLQDLINQTWGDSQTSFRDMPALPMIGDPKASAPETPPVPTSMSPYKFAKEVERVLEESIRPRLKNDGGDIEIIDIKDKLVYCRLLGACSTCASSTQTLKSMVETTLKEHIDLDIRVVSV